MLLILFDGLQVGDSCCNLTMNAIVSTDYSVDGYSTPFH